MISAVTSDRPQQQPDIHRDYLFRFAMRRVANPDLADDLVQETLLAAWQTEQRSGSAETGRTGYSGSSTYRVWLTGILKHKMMDAFREKSRFVPFVLSGEDREEDSPGATLCRDDLDDQAANDPQHACELAELLAQVGEAMAKLPVGVAEVFMAKEIEGETTASIAQRSGLSEENIWVRVHRARKALQGHLTACGAIERFGNQQVRWAA
jgi:RNA polymerase sigma-70 factor, ECF subfamily